MARIIRVRSHLDRIAIRRAKEEAQAIVEQAKEEAATIRQLALAEAEAIKERSASEGFARGQADAASLILFANAEAASRLRRIEGALVDLVIRLAEEVIGASLEQMRGLVIKMVERELEAFRGAQKLTLRIHPEDARLIEEFRRDGLLGVVEVIGDPRLKRGGLVIESEYGVIDGCLEVQLEALRSALLEAISEGEDARAQD
ncbi:MAG: FliH/SctL family protein [Sandaracinaceae bacterium]|nr:FliH/SctL family protein [Sandaracinaceae bacterium]